MSVTTKVDIDTDHLASIRVIAAQRRTSVPKLIAEVLRRDRVTKQAFATKEQAK